MNLVLVHGILGSLLPEYFIGVAAYLERRFDARVISPKLHPTRGVEHRAGELREEILAAFGEERLDPAEKAHLVAHSLGGLDSRRILSPADPGNLAHRVASLTTISTPHRGTPVADLVHGHLDAEGGFLERQLEKRAVRALEKLGVSTESLRDLTSRATADFDARWPDHPEVRYLSAAGSGRPGLLMGTSVFAATYRFLRFVLRDSGDARNDGLVPVSSARRGAFDEETWPADHLEEVGQRWSFRVLPFDHLARYERLVERLRGL